MNSKHPRKQVPSKPAPRPAARKPARTSAHPASAARKPAARSRTPAESARSAPQLSAATLEAILCAVNALTADVRRLTAPPPADPGADTDASAAALRRLLCDLLDRRMESVLVGLAAARARLAALADSAAAVHEIDALLDACGALRFEGDRLTVADPLIHSVVGYRCDLALPAGLILETTAPGFRTGHGLVLTKAAVIVNRRT